jgi:hypothetical protein
MSERENSREKTIAVDSSERVKDENYDPHITPAETAARHEREGGAFKHTPESDNDSGIDTTSGYTVDKEGLLNNYAIEPEMYYETPGDASEIEEQRKQERAEELSEVMHDDEEGKLTMEHDDRGHGPGMI